MRERYFFVRIDLPEKTGTAYWIPVAITSNMDGVQGKGDIDNAKPFPVFSSKLNGWHFEKNEAADCALAGKRRTKREFTWAHSHMMPRQPQLPHKTRWNR